MLTWVHHVVHLQRPFVKHLEMIEIPDAHIPMNCRHDPVRVAPGGGLSLRAVCLRSGLNPPRDQRCCCSDVRMCEWGGHQRRLALQRPRSNFRRLPRGGGVNASHLGAGAVAGRFKGVLMESACSIHIGSENIYPLWNGWSNNGPVAFKEAASQAAISSTG